MKNMRRFITIFLISILLTRCIDKKTNEIVYEENSLVDESKNGIVVDDTNINNSGDAKKDETALIESQIYKFDNSCEFTIVEGNQSLLIVMKSKLLEEKYRDTFNDSELMIEVYDDDDMTAPIQVLKNKTNGLLFCDNSIEDVNFDGYSDFDYIAYRGASNTGSNFYIWNNDVKQFEFSAELSELSSPIVDNEQKVIREFNQNGASSNFTRIYRFIKGKLICVRSIYMNPTEIEGISEFTVKELIGEELVDVINIEVNKENLDDVYDEYVLWMDID